jgi:hypothetical protein
MFNQSRFGQNIPNPLAPAFVKSAMKDPGKSHLEHDACERPLSIFESYQSLTQKVL